MTQFNRDTLPEVSDELKEQIGKTPTHEWTPEITQAFWDWARLLYWERIVDYAKKNGPKATLPIVLKDGKPFWVNRHLMRAHDLLQSRRRR